MKFAHIQISTLFMLLSLIAGVITLACLKQVAANRAYERSNTNAAIIHEEAQRAIQTADVALQKLTETAYKAGAERGQLLTMRWMRTNGMSFYGIPFMGELAWHDFTNSIVK